MCNGTSNVCFPKLYIIFQYYKEHPFINQFILYHLVRELEVCDREQFSVTCPSGSVILITSATYGRMREGRCVKQQPLGCQVDVLDDMDGRCSGQPSCSFLVMLLYVPDVCPDEMMGYVQATYTCVSGTC